MIGILNVSGVRNAENVLIQDNMQRLVCMSSLVETLLRVLGIPNIILCKMLHIHKRGVLNINSLKKVNENITDPKY